MFGFALLVLAISLALVDANAVDVCFEAKTCVHNGIERCGVDSNGKARRFLDACDIKEFNCIKKTDYTKTGAAECKDLPPLENNGQEDQDPEVHKYWCWRAHSCRATRFSEIVCAKDIQMRTRVFKPFVNQCSVFKRNCVSRTGFMCVLLLVQNNHPVAAVPDKEVDTALLVSQYYCHRLKACKPPARGPVCGYSDVNHYLADFTDECKMFKTNCDAKGRVVFYLIEKEVCDMKKKYDEEHKNEVFEWERISRVSIAPPKTPPAVTRAPPKRFSQRMKLVI